MKKINLVEMLQGCSKRNGTAVYASNPDGQTTVKRQSRVMSQSGCSAVDVPMTSYGAPDEHPMSTRSASDGTRWNSRGWKYVAMIFAVLMMSIANIGMAWGATHTVTPNIGGTQYEIYNIYSNSSAYAFFSNATTIRSAYSSWVSGQLSSKSDAGATALSGWLSTGSGKPGYGKGYVNNSKTVTMTVTNCIEVAFVSKSGGGSRTSNLSVKLNGVEVGSVATNGNSYAAVTYGTALDASKTYTITLSGSTSDNCEVDQIRFKAPAVCSAALGGTTSNPSATVGESAGTISCAVNNGAAKTATSYQWYKNTSKSTSGATSISGATSSTYSPNEASAGTYYYYCTVQTAQITTDGADAARITSGISDAFVFTAAPAGSGWGIASSDNNWTASADEMSGSGTVTKTLSLSANADLQFKIVDISGNTWYGNGEIWGGTKTQSVSSTGTSNNCHLLTTEAGSYTFSFNTSTKDLTITYPNSYTFYYANTGSWSKVYVYKFTSNGSTGNNAAWPGVEIVSPAYTCGGTDYYETTSDGYAKLIFTNNGGGDSNQTSDMVVSSSDAGKYTSGNKSGGTTTWNAFPTYTVTYNKNGDGAGGAGSVTGSVPTDSNSPYACGSTVTVLGNTGSLAKDGYNFIGWNTAPGGGGTSYVADATFTISANTTLYAQWELIPTYDVIYNTNGGTGGSTASQTGNLTGAQVTTRANGFTKTGYKFKWWNTAANGSGEDFYPGEKVTIASADVNLYAQWEEVPSGWEFWVGDPSVWHATTHDVTVGDMNIKPKNYESNNNKINTDLTADATIVSATNKHAIVMAVADDNLYVEVSFTDGKPINTLKLGVVTKDASKDIVVCYSTTADFSTGEYEFKKVGSTNNVVRVPDKSQSSKATLTDVSPSTANKYKYVRIYRKLTNGTDYNSTGGDLGSGNTTRIYAIKAEKGATCTAPYTVTVAPTNANGYRYTPGETISLTCTASGGSGGDYSYQWQKYNGSAWVDIDDATSAVYSKANCTTSDGGSYRCKVSTGEDCTTISDGGEGYKIRVWTFNGNYSGEDWNANNITWTGANTGTVTLTLNANSTYEFKVYDNDGKCFGCNSGMNKDESNWTFYTHHNNASVSTGKVAGEYTFTIDITNVNDNNISVSVVYPKMRIYMSGGSTTWCNDDPVFFAHTYGGANNDVMMTAHECEAGLFYADVPSYNSKVTFTRQKTGSTAIAWYGNDNFLNKSEDNISIVSNNLFTCTGWNTTPNPDEGTFSGSTYSPTTYTITFASNGSDGGSAMSNVTAIPCDENRTLAANTWTKTGHTFAGWVADVDVKVGGETKTAGTVIADGATIQNIRGNITLTAQWTPITYTITYEDQGGADFSGSHADGYPTTHTYGSSTVLKGATKAGYTFGGWFGNSGCTGVAMTSISGTAYTVDFTLYAKWTPNQYSVSHSLSNVTKTSGATGANAATYGTNYTAVFAASSGYALPETITVTIGGSTKTAGTEYTWDQGTGTVTIGGSYITGDIVITVSAAGGCPTGGDIFTLNMTYSGSSAVKVAANSTLAMTATHGTATGGTVTFGNQNGSSNDKMQIKKPGIAYINGDDAYIRIDFSCPIKTGDVLTFTSDENKEISFTTTDTRSTSVKTSSKKWTVTKAFNDATTLYIWRGSSSSVNLHTINIVRPVTVTFDKNGGSSVSPSSATYDGTSSCVLAETSRTDYHLDGWNTRADGSGDDLGLPGEVYHLDDVTTSTTTVYAIWSAKSCASGTLYKFQVNTGLTNGGLPHQQEVYVKTSDFLSIMTGGYLKAYNSSSSSDYIAITDNSRICIGNSSSYLLVQLDCPLRAGDKIKSTVTTQTLYVTKADVSRTSTVTLPIAANNEQTIPKALVGATELKIWSGSSNGGKISYFEIIRSASTYNVTYDGNDQTSAAGTVPTDATNYAYNATVTTAAQGSLAKTNYTFGGWNTANDGTGTNTAAGSTFSITDNTTLYAKWTQAVTLDANTANHGSTDGSATAVWNATGLTGITHAKPAAGYKLLGYYSAASEGTKVLNSDGSFAATNVTGYITSGKWSRTSATTLYAEYESAGALTWNLIVNSDTTNLSTSTKTSAFTEISTTNMTDATLAGDLTYGKSKKSALTGKISTPASYDADDYVYVTFQVASGYKFTPSSIKVPIQPVGNNEHKAVELRLTDASHSLVSASATKCDGTSSGKTTTVTLAGNGTYFTGTVTLKIYVYPHDDATATEYNCYRLGTPITIEGEIEETCATMPSYTSMGYTTTTFLPNADASGSPITIVGGTNIDTYQWKYNRVNDRTSGTNCGTGTSLTPLTNEGAAADVTRYYWCEMTNKACDITIKSPAVAITVAAAKSDATVTWTDPASTPNYGGGGYTIKATVNETEWNGNAEDLTLSAPAGIRIYNVSSGTTSDQKWVQADFDVQTSFDRSTYASNIPFTVSAAATASYNAISNDRNVSYSACTGAGEGSSYNIRMRKTVTKDGNYYHCANTDGWISPNISSSYSTGKAGTKMETDFDTVASSNTQYVWVRTYHANVNKVRIYADFRANDMTVSNVYKHTAYFSADSKYAVDYTAVYNGDEENENTGTAAQGYVDITLDEVMAANDILLVKFNDSKVRPLGAVITEGSAGSLNTYLQWSGGLSDGATVAKYTTDAYFTYSASKSTSNTNTLGAITYSSSDPSVATVDATGKVAMVAAGTTTIKATLAASGCYKKAEISYTLKVTEVACEIAAGTLTLTSGSESKCSSAYVTLTLTGFESGAAIQWKDGDTDIDDGGNYTITKNGTTSTLTTNQAGTYSVMVTKDCSVRSNRITISNKSTEVGAKRIVKNWYIKNGRPTPDIELWTLQNGAHLSSVAWSPDNATGLTASDFYESDGKVYLKGKEPSSNTSGKDIDYTLTLTVADDCGSTTTMSATGQLIYLHHQKNTDKHVLAFVVTGTEKGGFTEGITAAQTTSVELYNTIAANFDVLATNVYSTDDEQALKEYYSQFDILCVTDYPNTGTKGVNKKSYVDALGALVDIRPILTMEAFVAKLANWKAKGISGTPQSPTTRQYTMLLQCKDHEIFSGTELTKVGEGDETMYRVSMVDNTQEEYVSLDATYGAGTHEKDKNYQYGSKPALQGFTFTKEMLDDDLLPLGLIDDGSGNDLQVGIERQTEMEARLMVLGINGYAMERLTDDGQTVVVNALKYLMKKNSEDIADCSNTFVGGDDEEDESTRDNWDVASHWSGNAVPDRTQKVRIVAPCVIPANVKPHVTGVIIAPSGKYNHGANTANGSLTIAAGGALIVDGKVEAATAPYFTKTRATTPTDLILKTNSTAQSALIFDNDKGETQATVQMYSPSYWEIMEGTNKKKSYWSYVAIPIQDAYVGEFFYGAVTYLYDETEGWIRKRIGTHLHAFEGIGLSLPEGHTETFYGPLAPTEDRTVTLTKTTSGGNGENLIGNSWTAPIQIANFEASDFGSATQNVMIYSTGRDGTQDDVRENAEYVTATVENDGNVSAGQWVSIPINVPSLDGYDGLKVIPAMQAFQVNTNSETSLTLNYDKLVRDVNIVSDNLTEKQHAPARRFAGAKKSLMSTMRVRVSGVKTRTDVWLLEDDRFSEAFDNGWEATYAECDDRSAQLYAQSEIGNMSFLAKPDIEGTVLGFAPSKDGNQYLFTFHYVGDDEYYLNDLKLTNSTLISNESSYLFTYEAGDTNRFYISRQPLGGPAITTGVDEVREEAKPRKFIYNDKMYILFNGRVFDATGKAVK